MGLHGGAHLAVLAFRVRSIGVDSRLVSSTQPLPFGSERHRELGVRLIHRSTDARWDGA